MKYLTLLLTLTAFAQINTDPRFQVSWNQTLGVNGITGWNVAVMDRGTFVVRSSQKATTNVMPLTVAMFPGAGVFDLRVNTFTINQTSIWSNPLTIAWNPTVISAPKNLKIIKVIP